MCPNSRSNVHFTLISVQYISDVMKSFQCPVAGFGIQWTADNMKLVDMNFWLT